MTKANEREVEPNDRAKKRRKKILSIDIFFFHRYAET